LSYLPPFQSYESLKKLERSIHLRLLVQTLQRVDACVLRTFIRLDMGELQVLVERIREQTTSIVKALQVPPECRQEGIIASVLWTKGRRFPAMILKVSGECFSFVLFSVCY